MCKHDFKVYVSDLTVVTFCSKCGAIGDVEMKPSIETPVYPLYPVYPYQPWVNPWETTPTYPGQYDWYYINDGTTGTLTDGGVAGTTTTLGDATTSTIDNNTQWSYTTSAGTGIAHLVEEAQKEETFEEKVSRIAKDLSVGAIDLDEVVDLFFGTSLDKK